jgi:hypothetical protein
VQSRCEKLVKIVPAAPSETIPATAAVALSSLAWRPFKERVCFPKLSSHERSAIATLLMRQTIESALTEIVWLAGKLKSSLLSNKRAIALFSFTLNNGEYSATTAANARAAGPLAVELAANAGDTNAWPSTKRIAVARTFFMYFDHHCFARSCANSALASFKSAVSKPSVNQL